MRAPRLALATAALFALVRSSTAAPFDQDELEAAVEESVPVNDPGQLSSAPSV